MTSMTFISEHHACFDVCVNSGILMEAFTHMQQEGGTIQYALESNGGMLLRPYGSGPREEICATFSMGPEKVVCTITGNILYLHDEVGKWYEVTEATNHGEGEGG